MKLRVIIAAIALIVGACTGPGLEPPFSGEQADGEPIVTPDVTSVADAGTGPTGGELGGDGDVNDLDAGSED